MLNAGDRLPGIKARGCDAFERKARLARCVEGPRERLTGGDPEAHRFQVLDAHTGRGSVDLDVLCASASLAGIPVSWLFPADETRGAAARAEMTSAAESAYAYLDAIASLAAK